MIIIADSGSTKTAWTIISNNGSMTSTRTQGLNPVFTSQEGIIEAFGVVKEAASPLMQKDEPIEIYFYSAGMDSEESFGRIERPMHTVFPTAKIEVQSDLLAACRATCGRQPGMVAILGTGSNSCLYDGVKMTKNIAALGHGYDCDEGSGNAIGRTLIKAYLRELMPERLRTDFHNEYPLSQDDFLTSAYSKPNPNRFMASFAPFCNHHHSDPWIKGLLHEVFDFFFREQILHYRNAPDTLHLNGSIAQVFKEDIETVANSHGIKLGVVLKDPMEGLIKFHNVK